MIRENEITNAMAIGTELEGKEFTYRIVSVLGQGSFGIVYLAELVGKTGLSTRIHMVIKEFFLRGLNGRDGCAVTCNNNSELFIDYRTEFIRKAEKLSRIHHENLVQVNECFEANNTVYYVMNYIPGKSLKEFIYKYGCIGETQALEIARQLCVALAHLHKEKFLHLDVKPGNILLHSNRMPMLIDFGLTKHIDKDGVPETSTQIGAGTPGYSPLELISLPNKERLSPLIDLYSLGATLFTMLTGESPANAAELLNQGFPKSLLTEIGVSPSTVAIIEKAMAPSVMDRYTSIFELEKDINAVLVNIKSSLDVTYNSASAVTNAMPERIVSTASAHQSETDADQKLVENIEDEPTYLSENLRKTSIPVVLYMLCAVGIIIVCLLAYFLLIGKGDIFMKAIDSDAVKKEVTLEEHPDTIVSVTPETSQPAETSILQEPKITKREEIRKDKPAIKPATNESEQDVKPSPIVKHNSSGAETSSEKSIHQSPSKLSEQPDNSPEKPSSEDTEP